MPQSSTRDSVVNQTLPGDKLIKEMGKDNQYWQQNTKHEPWGGMHIYCLILWAIVGPNNDLLCPVAPFTNMV